MKIIYLPDNIFKSISDFLESIGYDNLKDNQYAFTIMDKKNPVIVFNTDASINNDLKQIIIHHERAHFNGISDEEEADRWSLRYLNKRQKVMLIDQWKHRHGKKYKEIVLPDGLKYGDIVYVIWSPDSHNSGLSNCFLSKFPPVYGLHWENNDWYIYNGKYKRLPYKNKLKDHDLNAKVRKVKK